MQVSVPPHFTSTFQRWGDRFLHMANVYRIHNMMAKFAYNKMEKDV